MQLKKHQDHLAGMLGRSPVPAVGPLAEEAPSRSTCAGRPSPQRIGEFEDHAAAAEDLNSRLYREVIVSRMRPFSDGAAGFPRMVRDMARHLGKQVRLDIDGLGTEVDRDILEKLEAPLTHLHPQRGRSRHRAARRARRAPASRRRASSASRSTTGPACSPSPSATTARASTSSACAARSSSAR